MSKIKGFAELYIGRRSDGVFRIDIKCESSGVRIVELELSPEDFANAITQRVISDVPMTCGNLSVVGKHKITESRQILRDSDNKLDKDAMEKWLAMYYVEEGWTVNPYLGSRSSITYDGKGGHIYKFSVYRYM